MNSSVKSVGFELAQPYPWQQTLWQQLLNQRNDRMPHALLFVGQSGIGKFHFAKSLAHFLLCSNHQEKIPCGQCHGCALNLAGTHPDLYCVTPDDLDKPIKIDQIRAVNHFVAKTAQQSGYRIVIIYPAENMNINSVNALLKNLEEPGNATLFMLVSHCYGILSPTLRSRCQIVKFGLPEKNICLSWLSEYVQNSKDAESLLQFSAGAPLTALAWLDRGIIDQRKILIDDLASILTKHKFPIEVASQWRDIDIHELLGWWLAWVAELIKLSSQVLVLDKHLQAIDHIEIKVLYCLIRDHSNVVQLFEFFDILSDTRQGWLKQTNLNKQLLLEALLIHWSNLLIKG